MERNKNFNYSCSAEYACSYSLSGLKLQKNNKRSEKNLTPAFLLQVLFGFMGKMSICLSQKPQTHT